MDAVTSQPSAGAQGELTGMLMMFAYHRSKERRPPQDHCPDTAHGTNPASAALCGFRPVEVTSDGQGILTAEVGGCRSWTKPPRGSC